jgi:hypothetical protein
MFFSKNKKCCEIFSFLSSLFIHPPLKKIIFLSKRGAILAITTVCGDCRLLCRSTHACVTCKTTIHIFCATAVGKKGFRQPVSCPFCSNAKFQVEIKDQVRDQFKDQVGDQVRVQVLCNDANKLQNVDTVDACIEEIQQ